MFLTSHICTRTKKRVDEMSFVEEVLRIFVKASELNHQGIFGF